MRRVILDVDTGHDDAIAIAMAAGLKDRIRIEGLIATAGNQVRENTLENTLNLAEALEIDAPVFAGSRQKQQCQGNGIRWAIDHVIANPGEITFVSVGPWTDLAVMLKSDERFAPALKEIVLMGGAVDHPGNVTESAEFNVFADPEAAEIVMRSGVPTTLFSLDVTLKLLLTDSVIEKVKKMENSRYKEIFLSSMAFYTASIMKSNGEMPAMHDPCTIAYLADPSIFTYSHRPITVETKGGYTYGKTTGGKENPQSPVKMGVEVDNDRFWSLFFEAVRRLP